MAQKNQSFIECKLNLWEDQDFKREWIIEDKTERYYYFITWEQQSNDIRAALKSKGIRLIILADHTALAKKEKGRLKDALDHLE